MIKIECTSTLSSTGRGSVSAHVSITISSTVTIISHIITPPASTVCMRYDIVEGFTFHYGPGSLSAGGLAASVMNIPATATASNSAVAFVLGGNNA